MPLALKRAISGFDLIGVLNRTAAKPDIYKASSQLTSAFFFLQTHLPVDYLNIFLKEEIL
jgi:hypothetical protein